MKPNDPDYFDLFSHTPEEFNAHLKDQVERMCEEAHHEFLLRIEQEKVDRGLSRVQ